MVGLEDHLSSEEKKFSFQEKQSFETEARTCKLFGMYIGEVFGLEEADAATYARTVIEANLEEPGFDDVLRKVCGDLDKKGIEYDVDYLLKKLDDCLEIAKRELP